MLRLNQGITVHFSIGGALYVHCITGNEMRKLEVFKVPAYVIEVHSYGLSVPFCLLFVCGKPRVQHLS